MTYQRERSLYRHDLQLEDDTAEVQGRSRQYERYERIAQRSCRAGSCGRGLSTRDAENPGGGGRALNVCVEEIVDRVPADNCIGCTPSLADVPDATLFAGAGASASGSPIVVVASELCCTRCTVLLGGASTSVTDEDVAC